MQYIWKFALRNTHGSETVRMPANVHPLSVALQDGLPVLWALVDPMAGFQDRTIECLYTGDSVDQVAPAMYLGTVEAGLVLHYWLRDAVNTPDSGGDLPPWAN